ncbi:hypothetical protein BRDCF_p33 [Bacteroidales bacterium CF]|jgi:hypothetical protein|nr:hypothetical protein BRDCF_p33 [Bacteroidales bacterium CF]
MNTNISHPEIVKVFDTKSLIITSAIAVAGIASLVLSWFGIASILLIIALLLFFLKSKANVYKPSGSFVKTESFYLDKEELPFLQTLLEGKEQEEPRVIKFTSTGSARIDYIFSADKQFAAFQLFEFIPHKYEVYSKMISFTGAQAKKMISYIDKCKK